MFQDLRKILRENIRECGMYIALAAIWIIFNFFTDGLMLSPRNLSNLFNQVGYIAVLAVGMTLVIVIRHIDLSVGFLAGFLGAVAAIMMTQWGWPVYLVIPLVLGLGILAGLLTATPVAKLGVPSFVASSRRVAIGGRVVDKAYVFTYNGIYTHLLTPERRINGT